MAIQVPTGQRVAPAQITGQARAADGSRGAVEAGRQMQQAGAAIQGLGELATQIRTDQIEQVNEVKVNAALAEAQAAAVTYQRTYSELRGGNAMPDALGGETLTGKFTNEYTRNLDEIALAHNLTSVQRERFAARSQPLRTAFYEAASKYEAAQFNAFAEASYKTAVAASTELFVANYEDPAMAAVAVSNLTAATLVETKRLGLPEEAAARVVAENLGTAITTIVDSNVATAPGRMQDLVDSYRDAILPSQAAALDNKIGAMLAEEQGRDYVKALLRGQTPAPGAPGSGTASPLPGVTIEGEDEEGSRSSSSSSAPAGRTAATMPIDGASLPTDPSKDHGPRPAFRTANGRMSSSNHDGVDFSAPAGTPVRAVAGGKVVRAGVNGGYGNFVEVELADGSRVGYAHLQDFNVTVGTELAPGQTLGRVGSTGNSTGPHLHLRYHDANGRSVDPAVLFRDGAPTGSSGSSGSGSGATAPAALNGMTKQQALDHVRARFRGNPRMQAAAVAAVNEHFTEEEAARRAAEEAQLDAAYAYIRDNKAMPPASMTLGLERQLGSLQSYYNAVTADPDRKDDADTLTSLYAHPEEWQDMTPAEFEAAFGAHLSRGTLNSFVRQLGKARLSDSEASAVAATEVDHTLFSRVLNEQFALAGVRDLGADDTTRQSFALITTRARDLILVEQQRKNPPRPLTEQEMQQVLNRVVSAFYWERPRGFGVTNRGYAVSYQTMSPDVRDRIERELKNRGVDKPTKEQVFAAYVTDRIRLPAGR